MFKRKKHADLTIEMLYLISESNDTVNELCYSDKVGDLLGFEQSLMSSEIDLKDRGLGIAKMLKALSDLISRGWISPQPRHHDEEQIEFQMTDEGENFLDQIRQFDVHESEI